MASSAATTGVVFDGNYETQDQLSATPHVPFDWPEDLAVSDLSWVANTPDRYRSVVQKLPHVFAWEDSTELFSNLQVLNISTAIRRWRSCLHHVRLYDPSLAQSMAETFDLLPTAAKVRFVTAPETFVNITSLRREPSSSVMQLCQFLNGESALFGLGPARHGYYTALGDYYCLGSAAKTMRPESSEKEVSDLEIFKAHNLADHIPVDFFSPNVESARDTGGYSITESYRYSTEEVKIVSRKLEDAFARIAAASLVAAQLIKEFVRVIIPLKTSSGFGSTSQSRFPGRVLLRGVERTNPASLASSLVHEAMHQLLYVLEFGGEFVLRPMEKDERPSAKSLWTGRDLPLSSFIHACFVWYGLSTFWTIAKSTDSFKQDELEPELRRCLSGFLDKNPTDLLEPHIGRIRYDIAKTAATLQGHLRPIIAQSDFKTNY